MWNARCVSGVLLVVAIAAAQGEKKLKDGEFDVYNEVVKDINSNNFAKAVTDLDTWKQKFPATDYQDERTAFYVQAYTATNQAAKAMDAAGSLISRDLSTVFPGPTGQPTIVRFLFNTVFAITRDPDPTPDAMAVGQKAAQMLMAYDQPIPGVSAADWEKARVGMKEQATAALLYIAMRPGVQAMAKEPPDCATAEAAYTRALGTYPDKSVLSYELGRALNCQVKTQPDKISAAVYEFERAAVIDPTLGDPKADPKRVPGFADGAYTKVHGSDEGLDQLKQAVRQSALPPAGFHIKSFSEIAEEKRAAFETSNPEMALWMKIKGALADTDGEQYFAEHLKDTAVPQLRGVVVGAKPACRPTELTIAVPLPDAPEQSKPEIRLVLDKPLAGKVEPKQEIRWDGVPAAFTRDPFLLTMNAEGTKIVGLKTSPCVAPPVRKK